MEKYHKIETMFERDTEGKHQLRYGVFRDETVEYLSHMDWEWTEKVDGTNVRVHWDGYHVEFGGRTDNAQMPVFLMEKLTQIFKTPAAEEMFEQLFGEKDVILFGEGYGNRIQKVGSCYIPDGVGFILFDVMIGGNYQPRDSVVKIAEAFSISVVPIVGRGTLFDALRYVATHPTSIVAQKECGMEGVVCRPMIELRDRCGKRVIVKIKWNDVKELIESDQI